MNSCCPPFGAHTCRSDSGNAACHQVLGGVALSRAPTTRRIGAERGGGIPWFLIVFLIWIVFGAFYGRFSPRARFRGFARRFRWWFRAGGIGAEDSRWRRFFRGAGASGGVMRRQFPPDMKGRILAAVAAAEARNRCTLVSIVRALSSDRYLLLSALWAAVRRLVEAAPGIRAAASALGEGFAIEANCLRSAQFFCWTVPLSSSLVRGTFATGMRNCCASRIRRRAF